MKKLIIITGCFMAFFLLNCSFYKQSTSNGTSHYAGSDCLSCHATGENSFSVAGTLYTSSTGAAVSTGGLSVSVKDTSGNELANIPVDASGNFYTGMSITFPVKVSVSNGRAMISSVSNGSCNACHNGSTTKYMY